MKTKIGGKELIDKAAKLLKNDEIVAFPTETVYGLGANAFSDIAVSKIFKAKGRPQDNPLIIHIAGLKMLESVAEATPEAVQLFKLFAPGPLTLILKKSERVAKSVSPLLDTVGIRIPNHKLALELIEKSGLPLAAPSANLSSRVSATSAKHVLADFDSLIPLIIDGGECEVGIESTIIDLTKDIPVLLRPGRIKPSDLLEVLPKLRIKDTDQVLIAEAPGMKYKHYAPLVECVMAQDIKSALKAYDKALNPVIIGRKNYVNQFDGKAVISLGQSLDEAEKKYFSTLREAETKYSYIILENFEGEETLAIMNRIKKSTGGKIV
ncbi:MAG: L-threonylcarbamoyladenylate synthase [Erysipelotrichales bacterium]|nr:L-threonylcarbamoyladenylate synthase [Erysipelotrichales bacterium]